jgi:hypothetical protein
MRTHGQVTSGQVIMFGLLPRQSSYDESCLQFLPFEKILISCLEIEFTRLMLPQRRTQLINE